MLGAFIVGCEVAARINRSSPRLTNDGGWHTTGIVGDIAAAAACAKLMKLPVDQVANAIGISVSLASGLPVNYGTMTKPLHCGNAARNGVLAAMLASKGFTSHAAAFEGNNGFYRSFGRALPTDFAPFNDLGSAGISVAIGYSIKNYPSGGRGHTAIEAALILRDKIGRARRTRSPTSIAGCRRRAPSASTPTIRPTSRPRNSPPPMCIAYSLVHGIPKIKAFTPEALKDERIRAMAKLSPPAADPQSQRRARREPGSMLKITLKDGQAFEQQRDYADRLAEDADDAGAARGEVHGLRDADRERRHREEAVRIVQHDRQAAELRRVLDADPQGLDLRDAKNKTPAPCVGGAGVVFTLRYNSRVAVRNIS